jgi:hypothetical protein
VFASYVGFGILASAFGLTSIIVSVMLLRPPMNAFFRDMTRWRQARPAS